LCKKKCPDEWAEHGKSLKMDKELFPFFSDFMMSEHKFLFKNRKSLEKGLKIFTSSCSVLKTFQKISSRFSFSFS